MDDEEFNYINAIPGAGVQGVQGVGVIGMAVSSTTGFWFEVEKEQLDWVDMDVRPAYTRYKNNK